MKDLEPSKLGALPVGDGKGADRVLGNKALWNIGTTSGFHTRIVDLPNGDQMLVKTKNGMPEFTVLRRSGIPDDFYSSALVAINIGAKLAELYMTSGAFVFGVLGGINISDPTQTTEPVTYKSSAVSSVESSELVTHYTQPPPANGEVSNIYNHTVSPGALNSPKTVMYNLRPSMFSGLMRRLMQARYGSGNTSLNVSVDENVSIPVGCSYDSTTGILRFGSVYLLVRISCVDSILSVTYWNIVFSDDGVDLLGQSDALEVLALSTARADPTTQKSCEPRSIPVGDPTAYGWSFSLTTNKAVCCISEPLSYLYDRRMWRLMGLTFNYDGDNLTFDYALTEETDGAMKAALAPIWAPAGNETIWSNLNLYAGEPQSPQDFPVYAYYVKDELTVIRYQWVVSKAKYDSVSFDNAYSNDMVTASIFGEGKFFAHRIENTGVVKTHGFYAVGKSSVKTSSSQFVERSMSATTTFTNPNPESSVGSNFRNVVSRSQYRVETGTSGNTRNKRITKVPSVFEYGESPPDPKPGNHYSFVKRSDMTADVSHTYKTGSSDHISSLVIPAYDCSAAYIATKQERSFTYSNNDSVVGNVSDAYASEWYAKYAAGTYVIQGMWLPTVYKQFCGSATSKYSETGGTHSSGSSSDKEIDITLYGAQDITIGGFDSEVFYPSGTRPALSKQVWSISSDLFSDIRYDAGNLTDGYAASTSGYPTDISLFIGAS